MIFTISHVIWECVLALAGVAVAGFLLFWIVIALFTIFQQIGKHYANKRMIKSTKTAPINVPLNMAKYIKNYIEWSKDDPHSMALSPVTKSDYKEISKYMDKLNSEDRRKGSAADESKKD